MEKYSEDTLGNEVMVESEASIVNGSALVLNDNSHDDEGGGQLSLHPSPLTT